MKDLDNYAFWYLDELRTILCTEKKVVLNGNRRLRHREAVEHWTQWAQSRPKLSKKEWQTVIAERTGAEVTAKEVNPEYVSRGFARMVSHLVLGSERAEHEKLLDAFAGLDEHTQSAVLNLVLDEYLEELLILGFSKESCLYSPVLFQSPRNVRALLGHPSAALMPMSPKRRIILGTPSAPAEALSRASRNFVTAHLDPKLKGFSEAQIWQVVCSNRVSWRTPLAEVGGIIQHVAEDERVVAQDFDAWSLRDALLRNAKKSARGAVLERFLGPLGRELAQELSLVGAAPNANASVVEPADAP